MQHRHFLIHKPIHFLSQFVLVNKKKKQRLLGELQDFPEGTMAVGRLDQNSEGLLLLTTDGKVSERIRAKTVEKEYYVQLDGAITDEALQQMRDGLEISIGGEMYRTKPCKAERIADPGFEPCILNIRAGKHRPASWASITINEGKNRQIRRMTAAVGFPTLRLVRWRIHTFCLGEMKSGEVVEVMEIPEI